MCWFRNTWNPRLVHEQLIQSGFQSDVFVGSSLVDIYAKCGSIQDAWWVFNRMPSWNVVTWNAIVLGHVKSGQGQNSLELFFTSARGRCATRLCYLYEVAECMCQCSCAWRGWECSWADHSNWWQLWYHCRD